MSVVHNVQNGGEFLIQHNTQKRHRLQEDDHDMDLEQSKVILFYNNGFVCKYGFLANKMPLSFSGSCQP